MCVCMCGVCMLRVCVVYACFCGVCVGSTATFFTTHYRRVSCDVLRVGGLGKFRCYLRLGDDPKLRVCVLEANRVRKVYTIMYVYIYNIYKYIYVMCLAI